MTPWVGEGGRHYFVEDDTNLVDVFEARVERNDG